MRCLLFALTGMGNAVVAALAAHPAVSALLVVSRAESGPHPYFPCPHLEQDCRRLGIACRTDLDPRTAKSRDALAAFAPDLILAATYHRILPPAILDLPRLGAYNFHPSLLPAYRGPTPTNWVIIRGEPETGLTVHRLTPGIDAGNVVLQQRVSIPEGMTDGQLRQVLASVAGATVDELLSRLGETPLPGIPQCEDQATMFPHVCSEAGIRLWRDGGYDPRRLERGLTPYPGPQFLTRACHEL